MLNSTKERSAPVRSTSLRIQSTSSFDLQPPSAGDGSKTPELAVELQHLHELKRQVAAQEQKLAALRIEGARCGSTGVCGELIQLHIWSFISSFDSTKTNTQLDGTRNTKKVSVKELTPSIGFGLKI